MALFLSSNLCIFRSYITQTDVKLNGLKYLQ